MTEHCWRLLSGFSVHWRSAEAQALMHTLDPQNVLSFWQCNPQNWIILHVCVHATTLYASVYTWPTCRHSHIQTVCTWITYVLMRFCLVGKVLHAFSHILWTALLLCKYITTVDKNVFLNSITLKSALFFHFFKFC